MKEIFHLLAVAFFVGWMVVEHRKINMFDFSILILWLYLIYAGNFVASSIVAFSVAIMCGYRNYKKLN